MPPPPAPSPAPKPPTTITFKSSTLQAPPPPPPQASSVPSSSTTPAAPPAPPSPAIVAKPLDELLVQGIYHQILDYVNTHATLPTPQQLLLPSTRPISHAHASRQQRLLLPRTPPMPLDPLTILYERERFIPSRIQDRIDHLEAIPMENVSQHGRSLGYMLQEHYKETIRLATDDQIQSVIKLKGLQLRDKQFKLRQEVLQGREEMYRIANSIDRTSYRKLMKRTMREAKHTEKMERQQRLDKEKREKQKYLDHLQKICNQGRDMLAWHKSQQGKVTKLGRAVLQYHQYIDREEQKRNDRRFKERIRALRNDDEEAYLKLIDKTKDTRLTMLLQQTGSYLESLSRAVMDQQNDPAHDIPEEMTSFEDESDDTAQVDYFKRAHRVEEEVEQSSLLVGGKLKEYQVKGLQWMVSLYNNRLNGILADEMGLGKTIQTISLITYLVEKKKQNGPFLIIVPLSTITNWTLEFEKWAPSLSTVIYKGVPDERKRIQKTQLKHRNFHVLLTTFDYIIKDRPVLSKFKWVYMIIDEGHRMKNSKSKLTTVIRQYYTSRYRLILTGTPLQNNLPELWSLLNFVLPKIFNSVKTFEDWFNTPFSNQGVQDRVELNEEEQLLIIKRLHKVLRPFLLRRLKKDVEAELPDKVEKIIRCKLSALQSRLYTQVRKHNVIIAGSGKEGGRAGVVGLNNRIMQLRKICNHPFVFEQVEQKINPHKVSNELLFRSSGKFELLDRILPKLKASGHRVLVFFQMTQIMDIMEDYCLFRGFRHLRLDGSTKAEIRSQQLQLFNEPQSPYFIFLLSTRAGGLGLNLQTADTVIIFDSDWNPHQDLQAQDRAHRIGQTKEVRIFRLITENSVEEKILARAQYKLDIDGKVIQAGKFDNRSTEEDREAFLRSLLEDKGGDDAEEGNEEQEEFDDDELNELLKRSDDEIALFEQLDKQRAVDDRAFWDRLYGKDCKYPPERLLQAWELPDDAYALPANGILNGDADQAQYQDPQQRRARQEIQYTDGMTERQWLRHIEQLEDEEQQRKRKKITHSQ
ncbi:SNF2 family N-terminal domain-containing protein [Gongronella butleri]|nr:SNF2 family N-terminal domain-containing protein [Gongronella butleri]